MKMINLYKELTFQSKYQRQANEQLKKNSISFYVKKKLNPTI